MPGDLNDLRIDKSLKNSYEPSSWATRWIIIGIALFLLLGAGKYLYDRSHTAIVVETQRVTIANTAGAATGTVILNATGYVIAHHKIELASKVVGKVAWIGVEKGDRVQQGQVIVRLEDDEYRAQLQQGKGALAALEARLAELQNGSRPEEVAVAKANLDQANADLANARISLERTKRLAEQKVFSDQANDDARARVDQAVARVASLERTYELVRIGPRKEQIEQVRGQIEEAKGRLAYYETQLANTVIRASITGTVLERAVEVGEFVTTGFVGDRGAKGYVISLADLNDLQVELDINQNDFAKLGPKQRGTITTDAFPDRKYEGVIEEISPEANRQKATVQVKVKVLKADNFLRPEMNASVAFLADEEPGAAKATVAKPVVYLPPSAVRNGTVFVMVEGKVVSKAVRTGPITTQGIRIDDGLIGGEDLIINAPAELKAGDAVTTAKR